MRYEDFNIRILRKRDDGYDVSVESPAGSAKAHVKLPEDIREAAAQLNKLSGAFRGTEDAATRNIEFEGEEAHSPTEVGTALYKALFSGDVGRMYDRSYSSLQDPESGLRIKLHLNLDDPEVATLSQLPWEYVYEKGTMEYLALSRQTPIVRYIEVQRPPGVHPLEGRLRILVVMSSPKGVHPLDLDRERDLIQKTWANEANVDVDFLENPTREKLLEALVARDYHVLHYMGHGAHDPVTGAGALVLQDDMGEAVMLDAQTLGTWLRDAPSIRLAFLNACDTGRAGADEPFAGVANRLVMAGLPAVVAMQFPISDQAAIDFARAFYPRIVAGFGVDEATAQGRKAILSGKTGSMEWGTPVLYMRAPDGQLFDTPAAEQTAPPVGPAPAMQETTKSALGGVVGGVIATALVAGGIAVAYTVFLGDPDFTYVDNPLEVFVGDTADAKFRPLDDKVDLDDYIVRIDPKDESAGIAVADTEMIDGMWQASVTGLEPGSYQLLTEVDERSSDDTPPKFSAIVTVKLDPTAIAQFKNQMGRVTDTGLDTDSLLGLLNDLDGQKLGTNIAAELNATKSKLEAVSASRAKALEAFGSDEVTLDEKKAAFDDWTKQFATARRFAAVDAQDDVTAEVVANQDELRQKTSVGRFSLCSSADLCQGQSRFASGASVHTHIEYEKVTADAERFTVRYMQDGNVLKERRFARSIEQGNKATRDYSTLRGSGPVEARLYNGTGDWVATAEFTLN